MALSIVRRQTLIEGDRLAWLGRASLAACAYPKQNHQLPAPLDAGQKTPPEPRSRKARNNYSDQPGSRGRATVPRWLRQPDGLGVSAHHSINRTEAIPIHVRCKKQQLCAVFTMWSSKRAWHYVPSHVLGDRAGLDWIQWILSVLLNILMF